MKNKKKTKYRYIHLIDGYPAIYNGEQICYLNFYGNFEVGKLVSNLKQIKKEQRASRQWRKKQGHRIQPDYNYIRVEI